MTTATATQEGQGRHRVFVPCPKDIKARLLEWLESHNSVLETFKSIYAAYPKGFTLLVSLASLVIRHKVNI